MAKKNRKTKTPRSGKKNQKELDYEDKYAAPGDERGYSHAQHGNVGGFSSSGNYFLKSGV